MITLAILGMIITLLLLYSQLQTTQPRPCLSDSDLLERYKYEFHQNWTNLERLTYARICWSLEQGEQIAPPMMKIYDEMGLQLADKAIKNRKRLITDLDYLTNETKQLS